MPSLNYKKQFAPKVKKGEKRQTIRADRKRPIVAGDTLYHFTGMRTNKCRRLKVTTCRCTAKIRIITSEAGSFIYIDGRLIDIKQSQQLAWADGFDHLAGFLLFFSDRSPFEGQIIYW